MQDRSLILAQKLSIQAAYIQVNFPTVLLNGKEGNFHTIKSIAQLLLQIGINQPHYFYILPTKMT